MNETFLKDNDSGDEALKKMMPYCPDELKPYVLWKKDIINLFRPKMLLEENRLADDSEKIKAIFIARVSTESSFQDPRSPFKQAMAAIDLQKFDPNFTVVGVMLDFFVNGKKTIGRQLWDELLRCLLESEENDTTPVFNAISTHEISRLSRRASKILEVAEYCAFFGLKLIEKNYRHNLADPKNITDLSSKAADAQKEIVRMGDRMSDSKRFNFARFKTLPGTHFGFTVENTYDNPHSPHRRIIDSRWVENKTEIEAYKTMFSEFLINPNYSHVANVILKKFNLKLTPDRVKCLLTSPHAIGIHFKPFKAVVIHPDTEKIIERSLPIPADLIDNWTLEDRPPYKYYIPQIKVIDLDTFLQVKTIIDRKRENIKVEPGNCNRSHRPSRENGKSVFSGILICGNCGNPYVLYGPSGTRLFACSGKRKKRCNAKHSVREDILLKFLAESLKELMIDHFKEFYAIYKNEFSKNVQKLNSEIAALKEKKLNLENVMKNLLVSYNILSNPGKTFFEEKIKTEKGEIAEIERLIHEKYQQIQFLKKDVKFDQDALTETINHLLEILESDPQAANEALKTILSAIEITELKNVDGNLLSIQGRYILKISTLSSYFKSDLKLRNFLYNPEMAKVASTEHVGDIIPKRSVEATICANFEIATPILLGAIGNNNNDDQNVIQNFIWKFRQRNQYSCPVYFGNQPVYNETIIQTPTPIKRYALRWNKCLSNEKSVPFIYTESIFDEMYNSSKSDVDCMRFLNDNDVNRNTEYKIVTGSLFDDN